MNLPSHPEVPAAPASRSNDHAAPTVEDGFEEISEESTDFDQGSFSSVFSDSGIPGIEFTTAYEVCLRPYVEALGWTGDDRHIAEVLPYIDSIEDLGTFRTVVSRLGFATKIHRLTLDSLTSDQLPVLTFPEPDRPIVVLSITEPGRALVFDPEKFDFEEIALEPRMLICCVAESIDFEAEKQRQRKISWFSTAMYNLRRPIVAVFGLTLLANITALATPLYVMSVYDVVISSKGLDTLGFFACLVALVLFLEVYVRAQRGRVIAQSGAQLSTNLMIAGLNRLLRLPLAMVEAAPVGTQILRLKQFENIHSFFTGPLATALLELPFVIVFFVIIAALSPALAIIPVVLAAVFAIIAVIVAPGSQRRMNDVAMATTQNQEFLNDAITKRVSVSQLRNESEWVTRYIPLSRELSYRRFGVQFFDSMIGSIAQSLVMTAGVSTLLIGAHLVMAGDLSMGALIAIMMLIWRILAPIQTVFTNIGRLSQFFESVKQVNLLMRIPLEQESENGNAIMRRFKGRITVHAVSFRYGPHQEPVFRGLTLDIAAGQFVCVTGASAGGKSTLFKLVLGLHKPQAGAIFLDGLNLEQLNPNEIRTAIGYLPQEPTFFYGTVAQNIRLSAPTVSDEQIQEALFEAGVDMTSPMFPDGIHTRLTRQRLETIPIGLLRCLSLARIYCKDAPIYLLNDPSAHLDLDSEQALTRKLVGMKGTATIILISGRPDHLALADRKIVIENGAVKDDQLLQADRQAAMQ
ncbi:MAG: peptidase domain-containing ABC transporter [Pseudomonadota bacterium]